MSGVGSSALSSRRNALRGAPLRSIHWMPSSLARPDSASTRFTVDILLHFPVGTAGAASSSIINSPLGPGYEGLRLASLRPARAIRKTAYQDHASHAPGTSLPSPTLGAPSNPNGP